MNGAPPATVPWRVSAWSSQFAVQSLWVRVFGSWFRGEGLRFTVQELGLRVEGSVSRLIRGLVVPGFRFRG